MSDSNNQVENEDSSITNLNNVDYPQDQPILSANAPQYINSHSRALSNFEISSSELSLLKKFELDVIENEEAMKSIRKLKSETQEKYLYQIKRYVRFCANKGLDNFIVTNELAKELIITILSNKRDQIISENTVKSIRSPLNKLYHINKLIYSTQQPIISLGDSFIQDIMSDLNTTATTSSTTGQTTVSTSASTDTGDTLLSNKPKRKLLPDIDDTEEIVTPSSSSSSSAFRLSESTKHKLNKKEMDMLKKFDTEVLESIKTKDLLENLTENTFKAYSTDIKRFIRFCAKQGKNDFLINQEILTNYLAYAVGRNNNKTHLKNLRTSLLKLHQLNCLAYGLDYSEGEIIFILNKFLESSKPIDSTSTADNTTTIVNDEKKILSTLEEMYTDSKVLSELSTSSKRLHVLEFNRYALFCNKENIDYFQIKGETILNYLKQDILLKTPNCSIKKLKETFTRLQRFHQLIIEKLPLLNSEQTIENIDVVNNFLKEYEKAHPTTNTTSSASDNGDNGPSTNSGASSSVSSLGANVPPLVFTNDPIQPALPQPAPVNLSVSSDQSGQSGDSNHHGQSIIRRPFSDRNYLRQRGNLPNYAESSVGEASSSSSSGSYRIEEEPIKKSETSAKRQKIENLPETNKDIPQFVMNVQIRSVTQLVEEWTLIHKRIEKWNLGWIKDLNDFQLYNNRKLIIDFLLDLLATHDLTIESRSFNLIDESLMYEIAEIFDQYMDRKKITLIELTNKIESYPIYTKKEFLRILTRRKKNK